MKNPFETIVILENIFLLFKKKEWNKNQNEKYNRTKIGI